MLVQIKNIKREHGLTAQAENQDTCVLCHTAKKSGLATNDTNDVIPYEGGYSKKEVCIVVQ